MIPSTLEITNLEFTFHMFWYTWGVYYRTPTYRCYMVETNHGVPIFNCSLEPHYSIEYKFKNQGDKWGFIKSNSNLSTPHEANTWWKLAEN